MISSISEIVQYLSFPVWLIAPRIFHKTQSIHVISKKVPNLKEYIHADEDY